MNELNLKIKAHVDALMQQFKEMPKHLHYKEVMDIERLELKVNQSEEDLLYEDIISFRFKVVLCEGLNDEVKSKNFSDFVWKDSYETEAWEFAEDYVQFCLEKFILEERELVSSVWREKMDAFIGADISKSKRIENSENSVPNHVRDYILKSLNGPEILYKLTFDDDFVKLLNEKPVTDSLKLIEKYDDHNFLTIRYLNKGFTMYKFENDSKIFKGLSRLSAVIFGFLALLSLLGIGFETTMDLSTKFGIALLIIVGFYVVYMLTLWVLDGFTNGNFKAD